MLITFEGIDASGKSTQVKPLAETLIDKGFDTIITRQPGGTTIGKAIREILLNPENREMIPETEVLLYVADRLQHIKQVIEPALSEGKIVLCDRYHDATMAYQGAGRQLDLSWLNEIRKRFIPAPDLTFWLDISVETSQARLQKRNETMNTENCRLEREEITFFERIRAGYRQFAQQDPKRYVIIDAELDTTTISKQITETVLKHLKDRS